MDRSVNIEQGLEHHRAGRAGDAETIYREVLRREPNHADALHLLGLLLGQADLIRRAIEIRPDVADYHGNLGNILLPQGEIDAAIEAYAAAARLGPDRAELQNNLGNALREAGRAPQAIAALARAVQLNGNLAASHYNLALAFYDATRLDDSVAALRKAIELKPDYAEAYGALGTCLRDQGLATEAVECFRKAVQFKPDFRGAWGNLLYSIYWDETCDSAAILEEHNKWNPPRFSLPQDYPNIREAGKRLRIGYVSPDFREHVIGRNMLPLLEHHNHGEFEIFLYSDVRRPDGLTERMKGLADDWRDVLGKGDDEVAEIIQRDGIDILMDLTLHLADNRLMVFARKPAPVQATFGGYPGTTGLPEMDYRLTDPYMDPPGTDHFYTEKTIRLPHAFWCFEPGPTPEVNARHGEITFGSLNNFAKVNEGVVELWARVLDAVPGSRMIVLARPIARLKEISQRLGGRVEFVWSAPRQKYLETYHRIDIALDTFPTNGHTTTMDAAWMGVPVVTLVGQTAIGRGSWSVLSNLNLQELAAHTPDEYVSIAASLAMDRQKLKNLRSSFRDRMRQSPLMDAAGFAQGIEEAYRHMWREWIAR